jgi:hypothetical protein
MLVAASKPKSPRSAPSPRKLGAARSSPAQVASANLKIAATKLRAGQSKFTAVGHLKVVQFGPGVELVPVAVASIEEFSAATAQGAKLFDLEAVVTGPQFQLLRGSAGIQGRVTVNGKTFGNSAPDFYYVATVNGPGGVARMSFGKGDPPSADVATGVGGAVPLLVGGRAVPGYDRAWQRYSESIGTGKNIVAYNSKTNTGALFVQPDGTKGHTLQDVRAFIKLAGYDYAVMFDGSGSTSLRYRGKTLVNPEILREGVIPLAIGFKVKRLLRKRRPKRASPK